MANDYLNGTGFYSKTNACLDAFQSHSQKTIFFANTKNVIINDENVAVFFRSLCVRH